MTLESTISEFTQEIVDEIRDVLMTSAIRYNHLYNQNFPSDVIFAGDNWLYFAEMQHANGTDPNQLAVKCIGIDGFVTSQYVPLEIIFTDLKKDIGTMDIGLFTLSKRRKSEVKTMGKITEYDDWFEVQIPQTTIKVFPLIPSERTIYIRDTGREFLGFIPFQDPKI